MRDKTPLILIEQLIMLLVFALAAALCLRAFAWADQESLRGEARDRAVLTAELAAETLKHHKGDFAAAAADLGGNWDGEVWSIGFDGQWLPAEDAVYTLRASQITDDLAYLGRAEITVSDADGTCLFRLPIAWQEVGTDA